jgi:hypothetical protein
MTGTELTSAAASPARGAADEAPPQATADTESRKMANGSFTI